MEGSKRVFQRARANIRPFPERHLTHPINAHDDWFDSVGNVVADKENDTVCHFGTLPVDMVVGALETENSKIISFGRVVKHRGQGNKLHMFGTTGRTTRNRRLSQARLPHEAKFQPAFIDVNDGKTVLGKRLARRYKTKPWTWTIDAQSRQIVMLDVKFRPDNRLHPDAIKAIPKGFKVKTL